MKRLILLLTVLMMTAVGCGGSDSSDGDVAAKQSSISGLYYTAGTHIDNGGFYFLGINFLDGNKIGVLGMYFPDSNPSLAYIRKQEGTYTKEGNIYHVEWTYETCDPEGGSSAKVESVDPSDRIFVTIENTTAQFLNAEKWNPEEDYANTSFTMIEDVDCDKFPE